MVFSASVHFSGIWPEGADGTDINTVGRNNAGSLVATGDDFGKVNLFRFPVPQAKVRTAWRALISSELGVPTFHMKSPCASSNLVAVLQSNFVPFDILCCVCVFCLFVRLFLLAVQSESTVAHGHSSHVTCVRFIHDDSCLLSTGGKDTSIMQWRIA